MVATEVRSAAKTISHFTPQHRLATFALRLGPFGPSSLQISPVCNENDGFPERNGGVSFGNGAYVCSENDALFSFSASISKISFSLQTEWLSPGSAEIEPRTVAIFRNQFGGPFGTLFDLY